MAAEQVTSTNAESHTSARYIARFADRLQTLQQQHGFSSRELANRTGLGIGTVRSLLAGSSDPKLTTLVALAKAFELGSLDQLLTSSWLEEDH